MIHYHGTPITPTSEIIALAGCHFCVSFHRPDQVRVAHELGQSVMLDNGAFSVWRKGATVDWRDFYAFCETWLDCPSTWAVIPDVIGAGGQLQDALVREWPHGHRGAPVWHMDEPISRLLSLAEDWPLTCIGSTDVYRVVLSDRWQARMDHAFNEAMSVFGRLPRFHMLRGMQLSGRRWPFFSVDSTDVARNHNRPQNTAIKLARRWDGLQTPVRWTLAPEQMELLQ